MASLEDVDPAAVHRAAPPASKQLVKKLPREHLTHARLQELGANDIQCSVCRYVLPLPFCPCVVQSLE